MKGKFFKFEVYVPGQFLDELRTALNEIGALGDGNYDNVTSVTQVSGSWRPLAGAHPYDGKIGEISHSQECKLEFVCPACLVKKALTVIRKIHPYEEPVINVISLLDENELA